MKPLLITACAVAIAVTFQFASASVTGDMNVIAEVKTDVTEASNDWTSFMLSLGVATVLCAAASPSPLVLPLALLFAFRGPWVQEQWIYALDTLGEFWTITLLVPSFGLSFYWLHGFFLLAVDSYWRPEVIKQFKIQGSSQFDTDTIAKVVRNLLVNQIFVVYPYAASYALLNAQGYKGLFGPGLYISRELPSAGEMIGTFVVHILTNELLFYYSHRLFHENKWLYKNVHKQALINVDDSDDDSISACRTNSWVYSTMRGLVLYLQHHEYKAPIALVASYCHPVEMLGCNLIPLMGASVIFGAHVYSLLVWVLFAILGTQYHHSGYKMPWSPWFDEHPNYHDYHHEVFSCNYGALGWLDHLHGTDQKWKDKLAQEAALKKDAKAKSS